MNWPVLATKQRSFLVCESFFNIFFPVCFPSTLMIFPFHGFGCYLEFLLFSLLIVFFQTERKKRK
ncbi:hypothetical protein EDD21DRAFT_389612 [Dissophora ornata]|nr:hypothetical protein EDD21DRAFT_389612 [Dissophora ornata]